MIKSGRQIHSKTSRMIRYGIGYDHELADVLTPLLQSVGVREHIIFL